MYCRVARTFVVSFELVYMAVLVSLTLFVVCFWRHVQGDMTLLQELINNDYRVHMQLDNLPVAIRVEDR